MNKTDVDSLERRSTLASAALRHLRDSAHLLDDSVGYTSPDQAFHLAGYGPECARKAALAFGWFDKLIGHRIDSATEPLVVLATALDPCALRYDLQSWSSRHEYLTGWLETCRYEGTGARSPKDARALLGEARAVVDDIVLALWMDGLLPARLS